MRERPLVGVTADLIDRNGRPTAACAAAYLDRVREAGGLPVVLAPPLEADDAEAAEIARSWARRCDAFVLTGGDDPIMEAFGEPTHPKAAKVHPARQRAEVALLRELEETHPRKPVLGICLGMQMMSLLAGGRLDQHMPETTPTHGRHWGAEHAVRWTERSGGASRWAGAGEAVVHSRHRQAVTEGGRLAVAAVADDGVIEAVVDRERRFYLGVQWHPERTNEPRAGQDLFRALLEAVAG